MLVGGGPTGVELAGTLAEIARQTLRDEFRSIDTTRARIVLIEASPSILATFPEQLRDAARRSLAAARRRGAGAYRRHRGRRAWRDYGNGERLDAGTVVWAAGVAASPLVATLGVPLDRAGRVIVNPICRSLDIPKCSSWEMPRHSCIRAARRCRAWRRPPCRAPGTRRGTSSDRCVVSRRAPFVYRNLGNMAIVGRGSAVADLPWARLSGPIGWMSWLFLHIAMLIGFRNRVVVMFEWAMAYSHVPAGRPSHHGRRKQDSGIGIQPWASLEQAA